MISPNDWKGNLADSASFVEFCLHAILSSLTDVSDQVTDQVKQLLSVMPVGKALTVSELLAKVGLRHRPTFRKNYLNPAMEAGLVRMEFPESPNSPKQRYLRQ